jgi:hypothetical protein
LRVSFLSLEDGLGSSVVLLDMGGSRRGFVARTAVLELAAWKLARFAAPMPITDARRGARRVWS